MAFSNINIQYRNCSWGPVAGRVYSVDHINNILIVKTLSGLFITSYPLDTLLFNEILSLKYDGYYFWTLSSLGSSGSSGIVINKWYLDGVNLIKQLGVGNEFNLVNTSTSKYESEAFSLQLINTSLVYYVSIGDSQITVNSVEFLSVGDYIYLGPSSAGNEERIERKVIGIAGNIVTLNSPVSAQFNIGDTVIFRKNLWIFNNRNYLENSGSLIQVSSINGNILSQYSSAEWKNVSAASCYEGSLIFVRGTQLLYYKPFGTNAGYQKSAILNNIEIDNNTVIKVYDILLDDSLVYKLQKKQHYFNTSSYIFQDLVGENNNYHLDTELLAPKVTSITCVRDKSILLGKNTFSDFIISVKDQYDIPILGRSFSVQDDDTSGYIPTGYNSFTTDSYGQGITRYNTGLTTQSSQPKITAIDVGTQYRLNFYLSQLEAVLNDSTVQQGTKTQNNCYLQEILVTNSAVLDQGRVVTNSLYIQDIKPVTSMDLEQYKCSNSSELYQRGNIVDSTYIEEQPAVVDTVSVIQYDFLVFATPKPYSIKNAPNTNIMVRIIGYGSIPLDVSTLTYRVNGVDITSSVTIIDFGGGLQLDYDPSIDFPYSSRVYIHITINDTDIVPRTIETFYHFDIINDFRKPIVEYVYPPDNSIENLPNTDIYAMLKDEETGIDASSIELYVNGSLVDFTISIPQTGYVLVSYQTSSSFLYNSKVFCSITAKDLEGNESIYPWNFYVISSEGVLFINTSPEECTYLVPVQSSICIEAFGLNSGMNKESLEVEVNSKNVVFALSPRVYRKD